jgi:hypothetical protein
MTNTLSSPSKLNSSSIKYHPGKINLNPKAVQYSGKTASSSADSFQSSASRNASATRARFGGNVIGVAISNLLGYYAGFNRVMQLIRSGGGLAEIKQLIDDGDLNDVHKADSQGRIPLMVALQNGRKKEALLLVSFGSDPTDVEDNAGHNSYWYLDNDTAIPQGERAAFRELMQRVRVVREQEDRPEIMDMMEEYRNNLVSRTGDSNAVLTRMEEFLRTRI